MESNPGMASTTSKSSLRSLIEQKQKFFEKHGYIRFYKKDLSDLSKADSQKIEKHFHGKAMMQLPESEIKFFEWLREKDPPVWSDLWDDEDEPYRVSIDFLHHFVEGENGFPICDLIDENNYWFTTRHIKPKGAEKSGEISRKLKQKETLSFEEGLLIEISRGSIDIWHFCYKYNLPVSFAKKKIEVMHRDDILVHLSDREDLVKYLDV